METRMTIKERARLPLICCICGDRARGMNFEVITCMSCKAFFRRNALRPKGELQCTHKFNCQITTATRMRCAACRLKKRLAYGMKPHLIRSFEQYQVSIPHTHSLLRNDRSTLTANEWNLLSNIVQMFDELNVINTVKGLFEQRSALPVKIRTKPSVALDCIKRIATTCGTFVKRTLQIHSVPIDAHDDLVQRNLTTLIYLDGIFTCREGNLFDNADFSISFYQLHNCRFLEKIMHGMKSLDSNGTLSKMLLSALVFSSNYSIVTYDHEQFISRAPNLTDLIRIQDMFITVLWKYLIYQYDFRQAVLRYSSLIRSVLGVFNHSREVYDDEVIAQMIDSLLED